MAHRVVYSPEAQHDLFQLYGYIAEHSGPERARAYTARIEAHCRSFADLPERGTLRNDFRRGLRITGFERRVVIAFHVSAETVTIDRILYGGRELKTPLGEDDT